MAIVSTYISGPEFTVDVKESDTEYAMSFSVFLSKNIMIQITDDDDDDYSKTENVYAIVENPRLGLLYWDNEQACWIPEQEEVQKAYSDYVAEKLILGDSCLKKSKRQ
jgi:hypothetical protein